MTDDTTAVEPQMENTGMSSVPPPPVEALSISDKFIGIITEPAATYENVRAAGARTSDWLVPVFMVAVIMIVGMFLRFQNPEFMNTIVEKQAKDLSARVESGKMTQEQADQGLEQMENMQGFIKISGSIGAGIGFIIMFFVFGLLYWLLVRFVMRGDASFALILSAAGLSAYISGIDQLLSLLLSYVTGSPFANLSPTLFYSADMSAMSTRILMLLNPLSIWAFYVLGIGFEKVAEISRTKAMITAFIFWVLLSAMGVIGGFGG